MNHAKATDPAPEEELDTTIWVPRRPGMPEPGEAAVYAFGLEHSPGTIRRFEELLSREEMDRAGRFVYQGLRHRYIAGRAGLRMALAAVLGRPLHDIALDYGSRGKPALSDGALEFNLSHSEGMALLALTQRVPVGVDIEAVSRDMELDDLAGRFFSPRERVEYRRYTAAERPDAFFRCWTRKEAVIKAVGDGLSLPLDRFDVSIGDDPPRVLRFLDRFRPDDWTLANLPTGTAFAGAVAVRAADFRVTCASFDSVRLLERDRS